MVFSILIVSASSRIDPVEREVEILYVWGSMALIVAKGRSLKHKWVGFGPIGYTSSLIEVVEDS